MSIAKKILLTLQILILPFYASSQKQDSLKKRVNFAVIPMVSYNKSFGASLGVMANAFYDIKKTDAVSPPSVVGFLGSYFINGTYFYGLFAKNYFNEDKWRTSLLVFNGNIEFQTYISFEGIDIPFYSLPPGVFVDYNTKFKFFAIEAERQIFRHFYAGLRYSYTAIRTTFDSKFIKDENSYLSGVGMIIEYDSRDFIMNPKMGMNSKIGTYSYFIPLGSTNKFHKIEIEYNKYFPISKKSLIMMRLFSAISVGDVPFSGQNIIGRDDLRGYTNGRYRADQIYDIQTEYRWNFYRKWGLVAFGGIGVATDNLQGDNYSGILPSIGTGIRFLAIKSRNINIGMDVAVGKDDWGLYFRIGEVFTH